MGSRAPLGDDRLDLIRFDATLSWFDRFDNLEQALIE